MAGGWVKMADSGEGSLAWEGVELPVTILH